MQKPKEWTRRGEVNPGDMVKVGSEWGGGGGEIPQTGLDGASGAYMYSPMTKV